MAKRNPFHRIRLVYRRSPLLLKILVLVTILASTAALLALSAQIHDYQEQSQILQSQAIGLQQKNAELTAKIAELGTKASIRRIATEELGLVDPNAQFFDPGE